MQNPTAVNDAPSAKDENFDTKLAQKCSELLQQQVVGMEYPGGTSRDSVKLILSDGSEAYASTRSRTAKAVNERLVLSTLGNTQLNVPKLLGSDDGKLVLQASVPGLRLTQALHDKNDRYIEKRLHNAIHSLSAIQHAGSANGFDQGMKPLGYSRDWLRRLLDRPNVIGDFFDQPAPALDTEKLAELLAMRQPRFVKWDARPGNAIARPDEQIFWIDWEHSGSRNRLDDLVWLLGDEFVPERPDIEARLLDTFIDYFSDDLSTGEASKYFYAMGVFHLTIRMGLIFRYKKDGSWWSFQKCLAGDKVGVTRRNMRRICLRGERWSRMNVETAALAEWFAAMRKFADAL